MIELKKVAAGSLAAMSLIFVTATEANAEWKKSGENWQYYQNGQLVKDTDTTINNTVYFFDKNGNMQTGWIKRDGYWYYCYKNGEMARVTSIDGYVS